MALSLPNIYQSTAILAPKSDGGSGGLSRLASQYGGLASLAGINLGGVGGDGMTKSAIALEKMKSLSFFRKHLYEDVLVDLMAVESWDASARQLVYDDGSMMSRRISGSEKSILLVNLGQVIKKPTRGSRVSFDF